MGLTTKIHFACDGRGLPLAVLPTPGQRHDGICARPLLERIRVPRSGLGRPRCRPGHVIADKADSSRGFRAYPRRRGIGHTVPEKCSSTGRLSKRSPPAGRSRCSSPCNIVASNRDHSRPKASPPLRRVTGSPSPTRPRRLSGHSE
ncbi:transposase [Streptomyces sp. NPDC005533]|uniref:transposase n=1 Tax=Streptomyces sp. NPDC005533 TaxID=3364723 RepID=UPI003699D024